MPIQPKRQKYRRQFKRGKKAVTPRGASLAFGDFGLRVIKGGFVSDKEIEAARRAVTHFTKRAGKIWIRAFPDKPITKKSAGAPMGGGKGETDHWTAVITPGRILFEVAGVDEATARESLRRASHKISLKTTFIQRRG